MSVYKPFEEVSYTHIYNYPLCSIAGCAVTRPWEAVVIGMIGGLIAIVCVPVFDRLKIDDPVSAASIHGCAGIWVS